MTQNEKWLHMLKMLNIDVTSDIKTGRLLKRELESDDVTWRITLGFDKLLALDRTKTIMESINEYLSKAVNASKCKFTFKYSSTEFDPIDVENYYYDAVAICSNVNKKLLILNSYQVNFNNDNITLCVRTEPEIKIVKSALKTIKKYFDNYGLSFIKFNVEVCDEGKDFIQNRNIKLKVIEDKAEAKTQEEYAQKQKNHEQNATRFTYTGYKSSKYVPTLIEDIPMDNFGVTEFKQINGTNKVTVKGVIVQSECKHLKSKAGREFNLYTGTITNHKDSIIIKRFYRDYEEDVFKSQMIPNTCITVEGVMQYDDYANSVVIMCDRVSIGGKDCSRIREDAAPEKRVELHAHTKMSVLDSILNIEEYVAQAVNYGHKALAVTDHENCHVLPEFFKLAEKAGIKPIAGVEAEYVDEDNIKLTLTDNDDIDLEEATYVVFDIETTGFDINFNEIIEIGAVKIQNGMIMDTFSEFVKPKKPIPDYIAELTEISNDTVFNALDIENVLPKFKEFIEGTILVAHNAPFDTEFIYENMRNLGIFEHVYPCIDTIQIARCLYAEQGLKRFNLGACAKFLKVELEQQHRAIHDAKTTSNVFLRMLGDLADKGVRNYKDINSLKDDCPMYKYVIPRHLNILVKNKVGLKNFYKIISDSHTNHFHKGARVTKEVLNKYREGLLVGSGCVNGEVFRAAKEKTYAILKEKMKYYDYIEVQPPCCYYYLYENTKEEGFKEHIEDIIKTIIKCADELGKPVVATGDVHELLAEDAPYRKIYLQIARPNGGGPHELAKTKDPLPMYFRSTTEMLDEFSFLPEDVAYKIVVTNTNLISDQIESYPLFPDQLYVPHDDFRKDHGVPSMKQAIYDLCEKNSKAMYGENVPQYVQDRLSRELDAIIGHGYFSVYYISHLLVKNSNDHGYVVGSRGSVGSSFVATMMGITEVDSLVPHYLCPKCHFSAFKFTGEDKEKYPQPNVPKEILDALYSVDCGFDLPEMKCPICGEPMIRNGINIAFETFLGFTGEKVPDIDLNFSGDYQAQAHLFTQDVFGKDYAFRAGTITAVADKTAYAYVRDYYEKLNIPKRQCELDRIALFIAGSKKTTGQHPGGIVVVPDYIDIYDITPIQFPPVTEKDDLSQLQWRTTHYDYHKFEANLLKLDILGHDDPTLIRKLIEYVHKFPERFPFSTVEGIPIIDAPVLSLFQSKEVLHIEGDDMDNLSSGTIGMPEFGTQFVRGMLETIKPATYSDILKVSGLSHGTDVWAGNAEALVMGTNPDFPKVEFKDVIGCRDDIMLFLMKHGMEAAISFKIMEAVRKGRGLPPGSEEKMHENNIPEWFIWSCKKIKYLFPKAHATAYVIMALRIGWFKVHRPIYYYAVYFSVRAKELDAEVFALGKNAIRNKILEIETKQKNREPVTNKEENLLDELKIAFEMVLRGFTFKQIDITKSLARDFVISDDEKSLYLPFMSINSLGEAVANSVIDARNEKPFTSIKDIETRTKLTKTQFSKLKALGVFDGLPDDDEVTLF